MTADYDVIVIGGGTAGAIVAERVSVDSDCRVLVLESGSVPTAGAGFPSRLLDAAVVPGADPDLPESLPYSTQLAGHREYVVPSARVLGGSSTINGGVFIRPRPDDLRRWADVGGAVWAPSAVLRTLRNIERDLDFGATPIHGGSGPIPVRRTSRRGAVAEGFAAACARLGFPEEPDKNAVVPEGYGPVPCNVTEGVRWNTGVVVLEAARNRANLYILGGARVLRVCVTRGRVTGVEYERDGHVQTIDADRVVLCAGAVASAQLLTVSGVGPAGQLRRIGVPVVADAPDLGVAFANHPQITVQFDAVRHSPAVAGQWLGGALHAPGLEVLATTRPLATLRPGVSPAPGAPLALLAQVVTPRRHGMMQVVSADPTVPPRLEHRYLEDASERAELRKAVRLCVDILNSGVWPVRLCDLGDVAVDDDLALDKWVAAHLGTAAHICATVPFGTDGATVDGRGRVRGVSGLSVADASILPTAPTRGPTPAVVAVACIVADDLIRSGEA